MFLTAIGAGLLRPILSTFGGEQFVLPQQAKQLATYFSIFYFSCQVGPVFAAITSPIIRRDVKCFGQKSCYPLAFGIPAIVMAIGFGKKFISLLIRLRNGVRACDRYIEPIFFKETKREHSECRLHL